MARFLHLAPDDKFVGHAQAVFGAAFPGQNDYRIFSVNPPLRFAKQAGDTRHVSRRHFYGSGLRRAVEQCEYLVIHSLNAYFARIAAMAPQRTVVVTIGWGAEYQHLLPGYEQLLLPGTRRLVEALPGAAQLGSRARLRELAVRAYRRVALHDWERRLLARTDVLSVFPLEYGLLQRAFPTLRAKLQMVHCYCSVEQTFQQGAASIDGDDVLVGNSAFPSGNHLEAFELLQQVGIGERKVVAPLSYGVGAYADEVTRVGHRMFGAQFVPLRTFMPLAEYNRAISSCATLLLDSVRQQAFGNICAALHRGARVYVRAENPILGYLRDREMALDVIQEAVLEPRAFFGPQAQAPLDRTRQALRTLLSFQSEVDAVRTLARRPDRRPEEQGL